MIIHDVRALKGRCRPNLPCGCLSCGTQYDHQYLSRTRGNDARRGDELPPHAQLLRKYRKKQARRWLLALLRNQRWARDFKASATAKGSLDELRARNQNRN